MGLEVLATSLVANPVYQIERGREAAKQQRRAADLQKEGVAQNAAQQAYERKQAIKQQMRQQRVRQAQVMSAAEASGVSGSSVEATTTGIDQTITAAGQAFATGKSITAGNVSALNQGAADAKSSAAFDMAQAGMAQQVSNSAFQFASLAVGG